MLNIPMDIIISYKLEINIHIKIQYQNKQDQIIQDQDLITKRKLENVNFHVVT